MKPTELPFLIVHGPLVWRIAVVGFAVLGVASVSWLRSVGARRRGMRVAELCAATITPLRAGEVVLVGTLRGGSITRVLQRHRSSGQQDEGLWLEHDGERIPIAGEARLEAGSRSRWSWSGRKVPVAELRSWVRATVVQSVADGEEIIASGTIEPVAPMATDASYRESAPRWQLAASSDGVITVRSTKPRVAALPLGLYWSASIALVSGLVGYGMLHAVGGVLADQLTCALPPDLGPVSKLALVSALPGSRKGALETLECRAEEAYRNADGLPLLVAAYGLTGKCPDEAFAQVGRVDEAAKAARRCGHTAFAAAELASVGRFDEAAAALGADEHDQISVRVAIARGDWKRAAFDVEQISEAEAKHEKDYSDEDPAARAAELRCFAGLLHAYDGDRQAFDRVRDDSRWRCGLYRAIASPPAEQGAALAPLRKDDLTAGVLWLSTDPPVEMTVADHSLGDVGSKEVTRSWDWLARFSSRDELAGRRIWVDLVRGDYAEARADFARWSKTPAATLIDRVEAWMALHDNSPMPELAPDQVSTYYPDFYRLRRGESIAHRMPDIGLSTDPASQDCSPVNQLARAQQGDAARLVELIGRCGIDGTGASEDGFHDDLIAIAPLVTMHRDALAAAVREARDRQVYDSELKEQNVPFDSIEQAADRRDLAHLLGDDASAQAWQAVVARIDAVLENRQRAIALALWDEQSR